MRATVKDVMTSQIASVPADASFKDVAEALIAHGVSAVPVLDDAGRAVGVVSEADLLPKEEFRERYYGDDYQPPLRARLRHRLSEEHGGGRRKAAGDTAAELMTAPPVTVAATASTVVAARRMDEHGVKRLVVVDGDGRVEGVVSRRDLLKVFVRADADIAREIREDVLERSLWVETLGVEVAVRQGIVTLSGWMDRRSEAAIAVRMVARVNGVVDVIDKLTWKHDDTKWDKW
ncbi:CBS domain-containing protein [Actinomadura sp. ATCC 31491]|uniref:CBS domain-containing protein n=1 Tax=Actinomadura luzonensis TaxID=2805427 RepID=A0ABT0G4C6_9ACTN|nr:CBS domain-containing protein [Actinomadura luzonensis]MCK2219455.1 CBS domain-containing protein [Actinomadura luzonensis]